MSVTSPKKICLFGPQGSGKGTQAEKLATYFGIPQVSPGNIFRTAIGAGTDLGKQVEQVINDGRLVPDHITNALITDRLQQEDCLEGFVLDGYPRNLAQADALDSMTSLTHVIVIDIPTEESIRRISERRVCVNCGASYHNVFKPSTEPGICNNCGSALVQRDDDKPEAITKRLEIYHQQTEPLLQRYQERGLLKRIDGTASIDEVWQHVLAFVE